MSKEPRDLFRHVDRHDVNKGVAVSESDGDFNFKVGNEVVGSLVFRTPSRDTGVTPEAVIAAVEDHLESFDPSRGETQFAVSKLEEARRFLAAGRDFAKIAKRELRGDSLSSVPVTPAHVDKDPVKAETVKQPEPEVKAEAKAEVKKPKSPSNNEK